MHLGNSAARLLERAGQPKVRGDRAWTWCVRGKRNRHKRIAAVLTPAGNVALVGSNTRGSDLRRVRVGDPAGRIRGHVRRMGSGLLVRRGGPKSRFIYGVRGGKIRFVAVATREASKNGRVLRRYLKLARLR
jgi:hypothetical protein